MRHLPRVNVQDIPLSWGDTFHLTCLSDLHIDSTMCDLAGLKALADKRRTLPNHHVVIIGDVCDLVLPPDLKRFMPSVRKAGLATRDDWFAASIDDVVENLKDLDLPIDLIGVGNHEHEALKRHGWDATSIIAKELGAFRGGYSGMMSYQFHLDTVRTRFNVAYHHGAWGGRDSKGFSSAKAWFSTFSDWDIALYGHNHGATLDPEVRMIPNYRTGGFKERDIYYVNCSSWTKSLSEDSRQVHYTERAGMRPNPRKSPLVRVTPRRVKGAVSLEVSVEM